MAKNNNKGFSLIEVIIAVAVFAILIAPLTAQLISAINVNTKSTKKQYAIEKAEEIMESFKTANMKESAISIPDGNSTGNYEFGLDDSQTQTYTLPESAGTVDYHINTYSCSGISLGGEYEKYDCTVTVNDIAHAVATKGYVWEANTNDLKKDGSEYVRLTSGVGTVRNLDNKQSAIIAGATYMGATSGIEGNSLDNQAAAYFKDVKVDILKRYSVLYNQYLSGATYLDNDSFQKTTTIKVSKTLSGYMVQCFVEYQDKPSFNPIIKAYANGIASDTYKPDGKYGEGIVYQKEYKTLPPIYLLYAPAVCNGVYCNNDYIRVETSGLADDEKAKIYLFETIASIDPKYEEIICDTLGVSSIDSLVYQSTSHTSSPSSVKVYVNRTGDDTKGKIEAYSNFGTEYDETDATAIKVKNTSDDTSDETYLYDIHVTLTDSDGNKTEVSGTRGK